MLYCIDIESDKKKKFKMVMVLKSSTQVIKKNVCYIYSISFVLASLVFLLNYIIFFHN